jgi:hypothetical protein
VHRDLPENLKISVIKPLLKKGEKTTMTNYTPISLLTFFFEISGESYIQ